jgi:fumarylacetoacetase
MADEYASHFGINNIPYVIVRSSERPAPQGATRISDDIVFLVELFRQASFESIPAPLSSIFGESTLNTFAALAKDIQSQVRSAIQEAYKKGLHKSCSENIKDVTMHMPVHVGDFTDYSASANHILNASEVMRGIREYPPAYFKYPVGYAGRCSLITLSGAPVTRPLGQFIEDYSAREKNIIFGPSRALGYEFEVAAVIGNPVEPGTH